MGKLGMAAVAVLFCAAGAMGQTVQGVYQKTLPLQVGVGFNFDSFTETPSTTLNNVGVNGNVVYYHDYLGVEAQVSDAFGTQNSKNSQVLFGGGGVRARWQNHSSLEPWAHVLIGYTHVTPQTSYGSDSAVGYKAGAGVDFLPHHGRIGFRVNADLFGTNFFHTYQMSPEISAGIVLHLGAQ
jgi:hypothetical protein